MPVSGLLYTAKREMGLRADGWCVHVGNSVVELIERAKGGVHIPRVDRRRQSVPHIVVHGESLVRVLDSDYRKNRTENLFLLEAASRLDVDEDRRLEEVATGHFPRSRPSSYELRPLGLTNIHVALNFSDGVFIDQRTDISPFLPPVTELERLGAVLEHSEKFVVDFLLQNKTTGGGTTLPRRAEGSPQRALEGEIQVRIVHYDLRVLASHLKRKSLVEPPAGLTNDAPSFGRAGEGNERNVRVLDHRCSDLFPPAVHELDHFGRERGFEQDLNQYRSRVRNIFRRLEDDGVSANQRREHLPGRNRHREVERTDQTGDTNGTAVAHRPLVPQLARNGFSKQSAALARGVVSRVDSFLHVAASLSERLPHFARHRVGDLFFALGHDVANCSQYVSSGRRGSTAPLSESTLRTLDCTIDVATIG